MVSRPTPSLLPWIALGASLAAAAAACGYPTFTYSTSSGTGGSGTGGTGETSSTTASSSAASSSSTTSSSTSTTSSSTGGPPPCSLMGTSCGTGHKCTVVDEGTGQTGCIALTPPLHAVDEACTADAQCAAGQWCEHRTKVCKHICKTTADCGGEKCTPGLTAQSDKITGLSVCVVDCDPVNTAPCGTGAACDYDTAQQIKGLDCFASGNALESDACADPWECAPGLTCAAGHCRAWCISTADCFYVTDTCYIFVSYTPSHAGQDYGWCGP